MTAASKQTWIIAAILTAMVASSIAFLLLPDYARDVDFLTFRLAQHLNVGNGLIYNTNDPILLTAAPLHIALLSLAPLDVHTLSAVLNVATLTIIAILITNWLLVDFPLTTRLIILIMMLLSYPLWVGIRSGVLTSFGIILLALALIDQKRANYAALIAGIAPLFDVSAFVGVLLVIIYAAAQQQQIQRRWWVLILAPSIAWWLIAYMTYGVDGLMGLTLRGDPALADWRDYLWIMALIIAVIPLYRTEIPRRLWIFPLWAGLDIVTMILFSGQITPLSSPALALTVAISSGYIVLNLGESRQNVIQVSLATLVGLLLIAAPPTITPSLADDITNAKALTMPENSTLAHDRSHAFTYYAADETMTVHLLDGSTSPRIDNLIQEETTTSALAWFAPDILIVDDVNLSAPNIAALNYVQDNSQPFVWQRNSQVGTWQPAQPAEQSFREDVTLNTLAPDRTRLKSGEPLRLQLDWSLNRLPEDVVEINISLLDTQQIPVASIFPTFPADTWTETTTTVHAIHTPEDVEPGLYTVQISLGYRAGILGTQTTYQLIAPLPQPEISQAPVGQVASASAVVDSATIIDNRLDITLIWQTSEALNQDYTIFVHITPDGETQPAAQSDSPPLNGSYPTSFWLAGEWIPETRNIDLSGLAQGIYHVTAGMYTTEGRLRDEQQDFIAIGTLIVGENGDISLEIN